MECPDCDSNEFDLTKPGYFIGNGDCSECHGTGESQAYLDQLQEDAFDVDRPDCEVCTGTGQCQTCGGTGEVDGDEDSDDDESSDEDLHESKNDEDGQNAEADGDGGDEDEDDEEGEDGEDADDDGSGGGDEGDEKQPNETATPPSITVRKAALVPGGMALYILVALGVWRSLWAAPQLSANTRDAIVPVVLLWPIGMVYAGITASFGLDPDATPVLWGAAQGFAAWLMLRVVSSMARR
jgi:hypothetical protein